MMLRSLRSSAPDYWGRWYWWGIGIALAAVPIRAETVITFESLPFGGDGSAFAEHYNGNPEAPPELREPYRTLGEPSGTVEQRWSAGGVEFENRFSQAWGSWSGWSWSRAGDTQTAGFENQFSAIPGGGSAVGGGLDPGGVFAVGFGDGAFFNLPDQMWATSVDVTNTTYTALSIPEEDQFSKAFSTDDGDFFSVTFQGWTAADGGGTLTGQVEVLLADFRGSEGQILKDWVNVDLTDLGPARSVSLRFDSTDVGDFGINTPTYVAIDNLRITAVPEPSSLAAVTISGLAALVALRRGRRRDSSQGRDGIQGRNGIRGRDSSRP